MSADASAAGAVAPAPAATAVDTSSGVPAPASDAPAPVGSPAILPVPTIESSPSSDATMLQALDAAAAAQEETDEWGDDGSGAMTEPELTSVDQFEKTLQSDVNENQAFALLCDIIPCDPVFAAYTDDDLERLARYLSVLSFDAGERIISKGEPASFCGIVLSGAFHAVISETTTIPLAKGALVGEMSYFEGGKRTADIVSAEASVLAVISFQDLKKLQPFEAELVQKFLVMLAIVSIRKLRNMMKPTAAPAASAAPAVGSDTPAAVPAVDKKPSVMLTITNKDGTSTTTTTNTPVPAAGEKKDEKASSSADSAQESLFKHRLKKKELALSQNEKELEQAKKAAEEAKKKHSLAQKKTLQQKYKAESLEHKLAQKERELNESREAQEKLQQSNDKFQKQNGLLMGQVTNMTTARVQLDKDHAELQSKFEELQQSKDELSRGTSLMISNLEKKLDSLTKASALTKQHFDAESTKVKLLSKKVEELQLRKDTLESELKSIQREWEISKGQVMILQEKVNHLDMVRKDYLARLNEEELAHIAWKSKADLYLGDYTRLTSRVKEMEITQAESIKDRRLTLRKVAQLRTLLKRIIARSFIRNVRTRRMIFAILKRVNSVVTSRLDLEEEEHSLLGGNAGGEDMMGSGENQVVSAAQARKDRAKLLQFLKADRTPVSKLIWLLDEELTNFESPFHALQTENNQLRHTLDSFFKRNIGLVQQFMSAKSTYESLHREYARLRDAYDRLKRKEKANASLAAQMAGGQAGALVRQAAENADLEEESTVPTPNFAASLPTPTPFSPTTLHPLTTQQMHSYAAAFSTMPSSLKPPDQYGGISLGAPRPSTATATINTNTPKKHGSKFHSTIPSPVPSTSPTPSELAFSPRPPSSQGGVTRMISPRANATTNRGLLSPQPNNTHQQSPSQLHPQPTITGSPWQSEGSYDISQRSGGRDVASRSEALRHQIQASIQTKVTGTAITREQWNGSRPSSSPRPGTAMSPVYLSGNSYSSTATPSGVGSSPVGPTSPYPHAYPALRSPTTSMYARHVDSGAFVDPSMVMMQPSRVSGVAPAAAGGGPGTSPRMMREEEKQSIMMMGNAPPQAWS